MAELDALVLKGDNRGPAGETWTCAPWFQRPALAIEAARMRAKYGKLKRGGRRPKEIAV